MSPPLSFRARQALVEIRSDPNQMGAAAAAHGAALLRAALAARARARIIVACAPSQAPTMAYLARAAEIDWQRVDVFHMDEYVGLAGTHAASFRRWLKQHLTGLVAPRRVHYLAGDAPDPQAECERYATLLAEDAIDVCFMGFGENGHIAFNDPHVADFADPLRVKIVTLDERCRAQQVAEGHFPSLAAVPERALTLTCPTLLGAEHLVCSVPGERKAQAVRCALEGPRTPACPASAVLDHRRATVFLDRASATLLRQVHGG